MLITRAPAPLSLSLSLGWSLRFTATPEMMYRATLRNFQEALRREVSNPKEFYKCIKEKLKVGTGPLVNEKTALFHDNRPKASVIGKSFDSVPRGHLKCTRNYKFFFGTPKEDKQMFKKIKLAGIRHHREKLNLNRSVDPEELLPGVAREAIT